MSLPGEKLKWLWPTNAVKQGQGGAQSSMGHQEGNGESIHEIQQGTITKQARDRRGRLLAFWLDSGDHDISV